jgi:hypothetical protein
MVIGNWNVALLSALRVDSIHRTFDFAENGFRPLLADNCSLITTHR